MFQVRKPDKQDLDTQYVNSDQQDFNLDTGSNQSDEMDPLDEKSEMENSNGNIEESFHPKIEIDELDHEMDFGDDETSCDVASFAQVTYESLETNPEDSKRGRENFCNLCQHTFTNKYFLFEFIRI